MDGMVRKFERLWCSKRLVYKPMTQTDETKDIVFELITDTVLNGLGDPGLRVPKTRVDSDETVKIFCEKMLLALLICLPAEEDKEDEQQKRTANTTTTTTLSSESDSPNAATASSPKPGKPIGYIVLSKPKTRGSEIALCLAHEHQNRGYGREAIDFVVDWGFRWADLHRVSIGTVSFNERAAHLYESMGFVLESRERHTVFMDFQWFDILGFSMLVDEWKVLRGIE